MASGMRSKQFFIAPIWMARLSIIACVLIIGNWFVFIPWKLDLIMLAKKDFGYVLFLFGIGSIFAMQLTSKVLIPRFGPKALLPLGTIFFGLAIYLWATAMSLLVFALMALPVGFAFGLINPCAVFLTVQAEQETGKRLLTLHHACFSIGSLLGVVIGGLYASTGLNPIYLFFCLMIAGMTVGISLYFISDTAIKKADKITKEKTKRTIKLPNGDTLLFGAIAAVSMGTVGIILDWSALWLTRDIGVTLALGGIGIFAYNGAEIFARLFGAEIIQRFGERFIGSSALIIGCFIMIFATVSEELILIIIAFFAFGFSAANFLPLVQGVAAERNHDKASEIVTDIQTISFIGFLFGPPIVGLIAEYVSIAACMYLLCIVWIISALIMRKYFGVAS